MVRRGQHLDGEFGETLILPKFPSLPDWGELVRRGERLDGGDSVRLGDETS